MNRSFELGIEFAKEKDKADKLAKFRERFYLENNEIYLDGNSLGPLSIDAEKSLMNILKIWKEEKINIWSVDNGKYFKYPKYLGNLSRHLVNAEKDEITITNSTTINIHQAISTFYKPTKNRYKILVDELNFPTDIHAAESQVRLKGLNPKEAIKVVKSRDGRTIEEEDIIDALTEDVAIALLPTLLYRSAQLIDMDRVTKVAHERGIIIGWDLCHSIGSVPHDFQKTKPDFAVWCTYKHLAGGPGSNAALYINKKHFGTLPGMAGWHGNVKETQFQLNHKHDPAPDVDAWLTGTANMLSLAPIEGALNIFNEAGIENIREKSLDITAYLMYLIDEKLAKYGYYVGTPREDSRRGGHVALEHEEAYRICQALKDNNITPDFREPNVIRLAPVALYVSYEDVYRVVEILEKIVLDKEYEKYSNKRDLVV